jgi:3-oxoadipate enol-lactonase
VPHLDIEGLRLYYDVHGDAADLLLILGLALDVSAVPAIVDGLAGQFRVIAFDNRGAGRSDRPPGPYAIPMMADDALALLDALDVSRARVVGISMGARIGLELARRHPERVADLVLVGAQCAPRGRLAMSWPMMVALALRWLPGLRGRYPQSREAFTAQRDASMTYACRGLLPGIAARTLLLHGERDRSAPLAEAREMAERLPHAALRTFRGGHLILPAR